MRGRHHSKVPDISQQPLNTLLPETKDENPHPRPYYLTQFVQISLKEGELPPWSSVTKQNEKKLLDHWSSHSSLQNKVLNSIIEDAIYEDVYTICSSYMVAATTKRKKDAIILTWLQEEVIEPTVFDEAELSVYEELWDSARMLTDAEAKPLAQMYQDKPPEESFVHFLRDHHRAPVSLDEGKSIYSHKWSEVLYHLNKIISKASLLENYAIRKLQEQFILNIAAEVMFSEAVKYMEMEIEELDQQERIENPPRDIIM